VLEGLRLAVLLLVVRMVLLEVRMVLLVGLLLVGFPLVDLLLRIYTVTDLQGPPLERTQSDKIRDLKSLAKQYARDRGSCDDTRISYLEYVESEAEADWTLARMIAG
jgi:hypothetical protein